MITKNIYIKGGHFMKKSVAIMVFLIVVFGSVFLLSSCSSAPKYTKFEGVDLLKNATISASDNEKGVKNLTDGKSSKWTTKSKKAYVEIAFNEPTQVNTIVMEEPTDSAKLYEIHYVNNNNEYEMIYQQDRIDHYRMCTFENITTTKLKVVFIDFDKKISISNIEAYYLVDSKNNIARQSYLIADYTLKDTENPDFISSLSIMTDVIIVNGGLLTQEGTITYDKELLARYIEKLREITDGNLKIHVMIGTYIGKDFKDNNKKMVKLVKNKLDTIKESLKKFVADVNPDGIDYDWEYPQLAWEWDAFNKLLIATKGAINGRELSVALWPYGVNLSKEAMACIDRVNAMAYDQFDERGDHSSIYECGLGVIEYFIKCGFSKDQILLGLPFYGRTTDKAAQWPSYEESYGKWGNYMENYTYTDKDGNNQNSSVYVNSYAAIRDKVALTIAFDIGGIMIWHFGEGGKYSYEYSHHKALEFILEQRLNYKVA